MLYCVVVDKSFLLYSKWAIKLAGHMYCYSDMANYCETTTHICETFFIFTLDYICVVAWACMLSCFYYRPATTDSYIITIIIVYSIVTAVTD